MSGEGARRTTAVRRGLVAVAGLLTLACGAAVPGLPAAAARTDLRLGMLANLTHAPGLVGVHDGLLARSLGARIPLRTQTFQAGPEEVTALFSGSIDAAYLGPNPAINAFTRSHGEAIRVVAGATSGGAALVVKPSIDAAGDLKGKTLATPQLGNTQDVALRYWLSRNRLRTSTTGAGDVSIHPQENAQTLQTFRSGQIAGAWVPEPWATRLVGAGGKVLVDERSLWPNGQFATAMLAVRTEFLRQRPDAVRRLIDGQLAALDVIERQPDDAQRSANDQLAALTGQRLAAPVVAEAWSHMTFTADPIGDSLVATAQHAHAVGLLDDVNLRGLFDLSLLDQELRARGQPVVTSP